MYKVLLVDDERHTREGLKRFVPWQQLNTTVCGEADDGVTALPLLKTEQPDILVTDVRMRQMDGIALARQAKQLLPDLAVIFLSGYNDPEYLQNAVRLSAADYLYKPVTPEAFSQVMEKVVGVLEGTRLQRELLHTMREHLRLSQPILHQAFLSEWLEGAYENPEALHSKARALELPLNPGVPLQVVIFLLENPLNSLYDENYLLLQLRQLLESRLPQAALCTQAMALVLLREATETSHTLTEDIGAAFYAQTGALVSIASGMPVNQWTDLPLSYQDALSTLENRFFSQQGNVLGETPQEEGAQTAPGVSRGPALWSVPLGDRSQLLGQLYDIGVAVHADKLSISDARMVYLRFVIWLDEAMRGWGLRIPHASEGIRSLANANDYHRMEEAVQRMAMEAAAQMEERAAGTLSSPVQTIIRILETEYPERLTIEDLAQRIHYSPTYLCDLFKTETGRTIGEHLMTVRLEKARDMLRTSDHSVLDIALEVGYSEQTHFTRLFKRHTGLTPMEYRRRSRA